MRWLYCIPRGIKIIFTVLRLLLNRRVISHAHPILRRCSYLNPFSYRIHYTRGQALRLCFEQLGPIFIKFGQLLSIRGDLFQEDIIQELVKLQDKVTPVSCDIVVQSIEQEFSQSIDQLFRHFDREPLGSASIAQVHAATLLTGEDIILKVLRPNIHKIIQRDILLMYLLAFLIKRCLRDGKLMQPTEIVKEFEYTIHKELNLELEAASASQLKENFASSTLLYVPKIYWQYTTKTILAMERIHGIRINDIQALKEKNTNFKVLAENGVEIFFTQLLRDRFFHADMHPGNLFIDSSNADKPKYMAVDFGIMGTLNKEDQRYIGENLLAFFHRDYRRIAELHVESGWVPSDTKLDHFTASIRSVAEPIFQKPLDQISFGSLLLKLIQVAREYKMQAQPQLMLLQKTLVGIESLGRTLYPQLDLWSTAQPFLEKWLREQKSPKRLLKSLTNDWQQHIEQLIALPKKVDAALARCQQPRPQKQHSRGLYWLIAGSTLLISSSIQTYYSSPISPIYSLTIGTISNLIGLFKVHHDNRS